MAHAHHDHHEIVPPKKLELPKQFTMVTLAAAAIGFATFAIGMGINSEAALKGYVIGMWFTMSLALSGPFFVATQHLSIAGWSSSIRRIPEAFGAFIPVAGLFAIVGMFLMPESMYPWFNQELAKQDPFLVKKLGFLNKPAFMGTTVLAFAVWTGLYGYMRKLSLDQDETGDYAITNRLKAVSCLYLVAFVTGFSFLSWYWIMALEPNWFSTMFSVYCFAGLFQSGLALIYILMTWLGRRGFLGNFVTVKHSHDLGKMVFGFTTFYAYIGFSQFLLIWYANIPEEDVWYIIRFTGGWALVSLALPFLKFIIPFLVMLPQNIKKNKSNVMYYLCMWLIFMQIYEVWYWVSPKAHGISVGGHGGGPAAHAAGPVMLDSAMQFIIAFGFFGLFAFVAAKALSMSNLIPLKDPFLHETLPSFSHEEPLMNNPEITG